ncbi:hypothetical protein CHS0354_000849 [Potamilus streckersoni]|uniref:Uncharacterized protein n=1 Tax=Potamilus streckersoni TaxID=2493646 RepID=A0AAE0RUM3_9BIVA|nr:hypothetical protein CHS0354_000849 [Potamilus streckersoni]
MYPTLYTQAHPSLVLTVKTADGLAPLSISLMTTQMEKSVYSTICRPAEINSGTKSSVPITHEHINIYVKSSGSLYIQNGSWTYCRRARRIKQKLVSKDANRAFGWTRSNLLSAKRWVLYSLSNVQKIY